MSAARRRICFALVAAVVAPGPLVAQSGTGRIVGVITDASRQPLAGATVAVEGTRLGATSESDGRYVIRSVAAGTYTVRVTRLGAKPATVANVVVTAGADATANATLESSGVRLGGVVVSASRRAEKITDAPATITRIDADAIQNTIGNSFAPALKDVKGIDFIQVGMTAVAVNARGFNSSFNNRMLMMEDNRIAVLPENGLPTGQLTAINKLDLAGMEVLVGPGSALYGPDASNGVITLQTKDPKQFPGLSMEVSGGNRQFFDAQLRYAGVTTNQKWGYKVTGEYQTANDWENRLTFGTAARPLPEIGTDFVTNVARGTVAGVYYGGRGRVELTAGMSQSNGLGQTNVGRNQLVDWRYGHLQAKFSNPRWFAQAYRTFSRSGGTFQLNGFTNNRAALPVSISDDSVRRISDFPAAGDLTAAEVQNNFELGMLGGTGIRAIDNTRIVYGAQFRNDNVSSDRQWLADRLTGENISVSQLGGYLQTETPLPLALRLVLAGRYDRHDYYDPQWSPKAALLWTPVSDNTFRVGYNRAFKSPTLLQTSFYFPDFSPVIPGIGVGILGNREGVSVRNAAGVEQVRYDPIAPELNTTIEVGYKGIIRDKLYLDVSAYTARYENFLSPLVTIANPLAGTFAHNAATGDRFVGLNNSQQLALTYLNLGKATVRGIDAGLRYYISPTLSWSVNASIISLDTLERPRTGPLVTAGNDATAFNTPTSKVTFGLDASDFGTKGTRGGVTVRYVNAYDFRSGVNVGRVPAFGTLDLSAGYRIGKSRTQFTVQAQNLFVCTSGQSRPPAFLAAANSALFLPGTQCGWGLKHQEMINAPLLGTMVFFGVRVDR
ncbi:MAG: TonB-dependent receptor [Gemmatimonadaceae bacterium]|nr:TonB-dependent receptor [Gemmatimonadaceae bacterium]